jgi:hypothetical protein
MIMINGIPLAQEDRLFVRLFVFLFVQLRNCSELTVYSSRIETRSCLWSIQR